VTRIVTQVSLVSLLVLTVACDNGGASRTVGITATGVVRGSVYFDANGSGTFDAGDAPSAGVRVALLQTVGADTLAAVSTASDGTFALTAVPVGRYRGVIDPLSLGDSLQLLGTTVNTVSVQPNGERFYEVPVGYPARTTLEIRSLPLGTRVFVAGVALHGRTVFSDTLLHLVDTAGAIRATRVRASNVSAGDSVRLRGRVGVRGGQRVLDDVTVFILGSALIPTSPTVTTSQASTASDGTLDARLIRVENAQVVDTATVRGSMVLTMDDGTGPVVVQFDRSSDIRVPVSLGWLTPGRRHDVVGVVVPGDGGGWVLRLRAVTDLVPR
jgi:hypothetical protein